MSIPSNNGIYYVDFIAQLCRKREAAKYLEIGVQAGLNLAGLEVKHAVGVDPGFCLSVDPTQHKESLALYRMTSDAFFLNYDDSNFDLVFLDGMHVFEYLLRDFYNAEARSREGALVLIHDCLPFDGNMISRKGTGGAWTGDVWKIVPILEKYRPDLKIVLVDAAPTGLVCISNLNPKSTVLKGSYLDIVAEFSTRPNDEAALIEFYKDRVISSAQSIMTDWDHSLYFRI